MRTCQGPIHAWYTNQQCRPMCGPEQHRKLPGRKDGLIPYSFPPTLNSLFLALYSPISANCSCADALCSKYLLSILVSCAQTNFEAGNSLDSALFSCKIDRALVLQPPVHAAHQKQILRDVAALHGAAVSVAILPPPISGHRAAEEREISVVPLGKPTGAKPPWAYRKLFRANVRFVVFAPHVARVAL